VIEQALYIGAASCLLLTFLASWAARSLREFSRSKLEEICRGRNRRDLLGQILLRHEQVGLATEAVAVLLALLAVLCFVSAHWIWHLQGTAVAPLDTKAWLIDLAACVVALLFARLWLPEAFARLWAESLLAGTWWFWLMLASISRPLTAAGELVSGVMHRLAGRKIEAPSPTSIEEEIRTIVTEGHREGLLEEEAREMIEGVIELGDCDVSQVMTPRTEMLSMSVHLPWPEALAYVNQAGHTRIPAYDKNQDDIVGILFIKDLLPELAKSDPSQRRPILEILRKPYFVPETKRVDDLLREFQMTRNHMAVVLDEFAGVCGLITIEDVLEEIVGEIVDEHDEDLVEGMRMINERTCEALARIHVDEINERLQTQLPEEEEFDTLGGFVFHELGRLPAKGEELLWNNLRITVVDVSRRRIERVRIEVLAPVEKDEVKMTNGEL
jgi:CBS domain containing-hemolysin-like protein